MEENKFEWFKGDKVLWIFIIIISGMSILLVYSATAQLQYNSVNGGTTTSNIAKHIGFMIVGLAVMRCVNLFNYRYVGKLSAIFLFVSVMGLLYAAATGTTMGGASASRWIKIGPLSIQPSNFVYLALVIYLCRYLTKKIVQPRKAWENIIYVLLPIAFVFGVVAKDNGSTALLIMLVSMTILVIGQFGWRYILGFVSVAAIAVSILVGLAKKTDLLDGTRVPTWISRVENHFGDKSEAETQESRDKDYQTNRAKAAIVNGGVMGVGPSKGVLKNQLPQSVSDFVFAVVVEEYGLFGASAILFCYLVIIIRIAMIAQHTPDVFGVLLVISIGVMLVVQIVVNVAVAVNMFPVTGQPLPLISAGGTSMLVTYIQLGLVLNVSSQIQTRTEEGIGRKQTIEEINDIA